MREEIKIPVNCPVCDSTLEMVHYQLFCRNPECDAKLSKQLLHFAKTIGIKGLGEKTVDKLQISSFVDLYNWEKQDFIEMLNSEKLGSKLYDQVQQSKSAPLEKFIAAFGIPLVGVSVATKLASKISSLDQITYDRCKEAGLGDKAADNVVEFMTFTYPFIKDNLPFSIAATASPTITQNRECSKGVVCITGKLKSVSNKAEAKKLLEEHGYTVVDSVTNRTTVLVDEEERASAKRKKAEAMGIDITNNLFSLIDIIEE